MNIRKDVLGVSYNMWGNEVCVLQVQFYKSER